MAEASPREIAANAPSGPVGLVGESKVSRHLTWAYLLALGLIGTLILSGHWFAARAIANHQTVTELVNLSGRQRMLSQQIALFALEANLSQTPAARTAHVQLVVTVDEFAGNEARLSGAATDFPRVDALRQQEGVAGDVAEYVKWARLAADTSLQNEDRQAAVTLIRDQAEPLLRKLDRVVQAFGTTHAVNELLYIERTLTAMAIGLLLLESLFIFRPLVRRVRAYHRRLEQRAVELAAKNEQLNQFAYIASHDLQEPLRTVSSFVGLLENKVGDTSDDESRTFMNFAIEAAQRAQQLVADMLKYCRTTQRELQLEQVDLRQLMEEIRKDLASTLDETGATLDEGELLEVVGVRTELRQLLQNLVSNAIKFRRPSLPARVRVSAHRTGDGWLLRVEDNGIGIAEEHRQRIFRPFQRLHLRREYPGTGIGLSLVDAVVKRHHGTIEVESVVGEGSTFICRFNRMFLDHELAA